MPTSTDISTVRAKPRVYTLPVVRPVAPRPSAGGTRTW
jgi:hypothetical protein